MHLANGLQFWADKEVSMAVRLVRKERDGKLIKGRYQELVNGAVILDTDTGIQWMRCSLGQEWNQEARQCEGEAQPYTWSNAMNRSTLYVGLTDWRLPTIAELRSIVHCSSHHPFLIGMDAGHNGCEGRAQVPMLVDKVFPNTPPKTYWSSTERRGDEEDFFNLSEAAYAWTLDFGTGKDDWEYHLNRSHKALVRMVRHTKQSHTIQARYQIQGEGEVIVDKKTGLQWQRCSVGQTWDQTMHACVGEAKSLEWTAAKEVERSGSGWRLPTLNELKSLVYCSNNNPIHIGMGNGFNGCYNEYQAPTIVNEAFPNTLPDRYWTSSTTREHFHAWSISFARGEMKPAYQMAGLNVRLVKDGEG